MCTCEGGSENRGKPWGRGGGGGRGGRLGEGSEGPRRWSSSATKLHHQIWRFFVGSHRGTAPLRPGPRRIITRDWTPVFSLKHRPGRTRRGVWGPRLADSRDPGFIFRSCPCRKSPCLPLLSKCLLGTLVSRRAAGTGREDPQPDKNPSQSWLL